MAKQGKRYHVFLHSMKAGTTRVTSSPVDVGTAESMVAAGEAMIRRDGIRGARYTKLAV